jgi:hypothetical protein
MGDQGVYRQTHGNGPGGACLFLFTKAVYGRASAGTEKRFGTLYINDFLSFFTPVPAVLATLSNASHGVLALLI